MRKVLVLPLAAAIVLAGCGKSDEAPAGKEGAQPGSGAAAAAAVMPDPGLYKIGVEILEFNMPGMPAGMDAQMKNSMSSAMAIENCLTKADQADAVKQMTKGADNGSCKYSKYDISGGKIDALMSCDMGKGATSSYAMNGTITTQGVDMTMVSDQKNPDMPGGAIHMKMHLTSKRVGECKT